MAFDFMDLVKNEDAPPEDHPAQNDKAGSMTDPACGGFGFMHKSILEYGLSTKAIALYAVMCTYADHSTRELYPSRAVLMRGAGISAVNTYTSALRELEEAGLVEVERRFKKQDGQFMTNIYRLNPPPIPP